MGEAIAGGAADDATDEEAPIVIDEAAYHEWKTVAEVTSRP